MGRQILIIDDHDDLGSALKTEFEMLGHQVETVETRTQACAINEIDNFDIVITDLDNTIIAAEIAKHDTDTTCLPEINGNSSKETIKAFKICAANFHRENFIEEELKNLVEIVLNFKAEFIDQTNTVKHIHEKIEFEIPSAISLMHTILDYLINRVEKVGLVNSESSNLFIALDEAFVNAVKHGNKYDSNKLVRITADVNAKEARFTVEDEGEGFDISAIPDPLDPENLFKTSGRGVLIIHNVMDEVKYNERGNRVEMVKKSDKQLVPSN
jgi:serine/threonine-protein kinase RsbW